MIWRNPHKYLIKVDKVEYIQLVKQIPSPEGRAAALAIFCHQVDEAEGILLQAGLIYRAIDTNIKLFRWERLVFMHIFVSCWYSPHPHDLRALDLAVKNKTHLDTVISARQLYLADLNRPETSKKFLQFSEGLEINRETIAAKIAQEIEAEKRRPAK